MQNEVPDELGFASDEQKHLFTTLLAEHDGLTDMAKTIREVALVTIRSGRQMQIDEDLLWAATVVNVSRGLNLDLTLIPQLTAAVLAAGLLIELAGEKG